MSIEEAEANLKRDIERLPDVVKAVDAASKRLEQTEAENMALRKVTTFEAVECDSCKAESASTIVNGTTRLPEGWGYVEIFRKPMHLCKECLGKPAGEMIDLALGKKS